MNFLRTCLRLVFPTFSLRNSRTVQYAFSFLFLFAAVIGMATLSTSSSSSVHLVVNQTSVEVGNVFSIDVFVTARTPVNTVDLSVDIPSTYLEVLGIDRGESVLTLWTEDPRVVAGAVVLRGGTFKKGFIGEHKIATINVRAKLPGTAEFITSNAKLLAGDGKGTNVSVDITNATNKTRIYAMGEKPATTEVPDTEVATVTIVGGDGVVTLTDISSFMANWAKPNILYDFNNDGVMTLGDFSILLAAYFTR